MSEARLGETQKASPCWKLLWGWLTSSSRHPPLRPNRSKSLDEAVYRAGKQARKQADGCGRTRPLSTEQTAVTLHPAVVEYQLIHLQ